MIMLYARVYIKVLNFNIYYLLHSTNSKFWFSSVYLLYPNPWLLTIEEMVLFYEKSYNCNFFLFANKYYSREKLQLTKVLQIPYFHSINSCLLILLYLFIQYIYYSQNIYYLCQWWLVTVWQETRENFVKYFMYNLSGVFC